MPLAPVLPETAPFSPEQRAWLNGFFAGVLGDPSTVPAGMPETAAGSSSAQVAGSLPAANVQPPAAAQEDLPWHDPLLTLDERMALAESRPLPLKLMAAMGQLDCGQCGYDCRRYADALATGAEKKRNLCIPGGKPTQRKVAQLIEAGPMAPAGNGAAVASPAPPQAVAAAIPAAIPAPVAAAPASPVQAIAPSVPMEGPFSRDRPANAFLARCQRLCKPSSLKDTRLIMLDLAETGIAYQSGDSLGLFAENWTDLVDHLLAQLTYTGEEAVLGHAGAPMAVRDALMTRDLASITPALLELIEREAASPAAKRALELVVQREEMGDTESAPDVLDILKKFPKLKLTADEFVQALDPLRPRLYSISSSPLAFPRQVHLTVDAVRFSAGGRVRKGVASTFLSERLLAGRPVPVFVQTSHGFRLPSAPQTPIIMIGPGTGIAPFRAFLQERRALGNSGKSWLFFGNPHRQQDFLYEDELAGFLKSGGLTRLDAAFSRDQPQKIYVQDLMAQHGKELWAWLAEGAHVYVCGDAKRMARDVHHRLRQVVIDHSGLPTDQAEQLISQMARTGRYQRDVY